MPAAIAPAANPASTVTQDGATPPAPKTELPNPVLTLEQARAHLRGTSGDMPTGRTPDPLDDASREIDPLQVSTELPDPFDGTNQAVNEAVAALEGTSSETPAATETATETPADTETPAEEVVETPTPEAKAAQATEDEGRKRLNINRKGPDGKFVHDAKTRAFMHLLADGTPDAEAFEQVYGGQAPAKVEEPPKPVEAPKPTVAEIETQIKALRQERKTAADNLDTAKQNEITEKIEDLMTERFEAVRRQEREEVQQVQQISAFEQDQESNIAAVNELFPGAFNVESPLNTAIQEEMRRMGENHPALQSSDWPWIAARVAARLGIAPAKPGAPAKAAAPKPAAPAAPKPATAPKARATPAPGSPGGAAPALNPVQEVAARMADESLPLAERNKAARKYYQLTNAGKAA